METFDRCPKCGSCYVSEMLGRGGHALDGRWICIECGETWNPRDGFHHLAAFGDTFARAIVYDALAQLGGISLELGVRELEKADFCTFRVAEAPSITGYTLGLMAWAVDGVPTVRRQKGEVQGVYVLWPPGQDGRHPLAKAGE